MEMTKDTKGRFLSHAKVLIIDCQNFKSNEISNSKLVWYRL